MRSAFWLVVLGCGDPAPSDPPASTSDDPPTDGVETDTDADVDADADADTDADADADADADTGTPPETTGETSDTGETAIPVVDLDLDGLDDAWEQQIAESWLPFLSLSPDDDCATMGIVYRARPHPQDPSKVHLVYVMLYDVDCGSLGHPGDDEVFATTVDPLVPGPAGILAMRAVAHQDTFCDNATECGCGLDPCTTQAWQGADWPVVFASEDKHGNYLSEDTCDGACFFTSTCDLAPAPPTPILVNAGEPGAPLTNDLTASGLITAANGWTSPELYDYDPWSGDDFGDAGNVADDLVDPAFDTPLCP